MTRQTLYSKPRPKGPAAAPAVAETAAREAAAPPTTPLPLLRGWRRFERSAMFASTVLATLVALGLYALVSPQPKVLTQRDIDAAVRHTLDKRPPDPSRASVAYGVIAPSVVLVRRLGAEDDKDAKSKTKKKDKGDKPEDGTPLKPRVEKKNGEGYKLQGLGTGVVFSEDGMIFTCLHVVAGAERVGVTFYDGTESDVELVTAQPENDLAVLRAKTLPDDLIPATLRSTKGLRSGDEVVAVGFPFGIGPTATAGVVSGLRREHFSEEGKRNLVDLIQFDAAANPGNSGGPLVTADGDVVGIVTSIMNPIDQGFFVGIGFAVPIENAASAAGLSPF